MDAKFMKNKQGNIMINLLLLVLGLGVLIVMTGPIVAMVDIARQSDNLNCPGFIYLGNANATLSYNSSLNSNLLGCVAATLFLPMLWLVFIVVSVSKVLYDKGPDFIDTGTY